MWGSYLAYFLLQMMDLGRIPDVSVFSEFNLSTCEQFEARKSNRFIVVCRSSLKPDRFILEIGGYVEKPSQLDESTKSLINIAAASALGVPVPVFTDDDTWKDTQLWKEAAREYIRAMYGPDAYLYYFETFPDFSDNYSHHYRFQVMPADRLPPWGRWGLKKGEPVKVSVEVLDNY